MRLTTNTEILKWLNERKRSEVNSQPLTIRDAPCGKPDDLSGGGITYEGIPVTGIQFVDSKGNGSVLSNSTDVEKKGAHFHVGKTTFVWFREGEEQLLNLVGHDLRLIHVDVHCNV